jgi:hypothetical protein
MAAENDNMDSPARCGRSPDRAAGPNDSRPRRAWYRLHWLTLLVVAAMAAVVVYANRLNISPHAGEVASSGRPRPSTVSRGSDDPWAALLNITMTAEDFAYGWPFRYRSFFVVETGFGPASKRPPVVEKHTVLDSPGALLADVAVGLVMVVCIGTLVEARLRGPWLQFGLRDLLVATAATAVVLSLWRVCGKLETAFGQEQFVTQVFRFPVYIYVPLLAGLALTLYAILWAAMVAVAAAVKCIARATHKVPSPFGRGLG